MRYLALLLIAAAFTGCSSHRASTLNEWKTNHPAAQVQLHIPANPQSPESLSVYTFSETYADYDFMTDKMVTRRDVISLAVDQAGNLVMESAQ